MSVLPPAATGLINSSVGGIFMAASLALILPIMTFWDAINRRFISDNLVAFEVRPGDTSELFFSYISKDVLGTISTSVFWGLMALLALVIFWTVTATYNRIVDILTIETEFENKSHSYLTEVGGLIIQRVAVALAAIIIVLMLLKLVVPQVMGVLIYYLLADPVTIASVALTVFWLVLLWLTLSLVWLTVKIAYRSLKTAGS